MNTKISVTLVALSMVSIAAVGVVAALPLYFPTGAGPADIGPDVNSPCQTPAGVPIDGKTGFSGNAAGTTNGYHRYINEHSGTILDACLGGTAPVLAYAGCAQANAVIDVGTGSATITGTIPPTVPQILLGAAQATDGAGDLYQTDCNGLAGTGTDGEYEYGDNLAVLNVRTGADPTLGGDGADGCLAAWSSAHHGGDSTVNVLDVVANGAVGFTVAADWSRDATTSSTGLDHNKRPGDSHCGDQAIEPCTTGFPGYENAFTRAGSPIGVANALALVAYASGTPVPGPSSQSLGATLDYAFGCNPLDVSEYQAPHAITDVVGGVGVGLGANPNTWSPSAGGLLSAYGSGGAAGWLYVFLDTGSEANVCFDVTGTSCPAVNADGQVGTPVVAGKLVVYGATEVSAPVAGFIWTS